MAPLFLGALASAAAAFTRPFTDGADVAVSLVLVAAMLALVGQRMPAPSAGLPIRRVTGSTAPSPRRWLPWAIAVVAAVGWELFCLFSLPRSSHPTISSMLDAADGSHVGRAIAFASWLVLGWYVITR